ncbi:MAG TPA: FGGY family carbohydrate kinase [Terracidiphilus sp.]|nr:FGGY family carbohydrate kinase [Terracidiphilus sp.]
MTGECILAIDQGTTNTKALLVDRDGRTVFRTSAPLALLQPQPGFVEQDPEALWESVRRVVAACAEHAKSAGATIAGIAISNQRETAVTWKRTPQGEPVGNAITWQCRRSAPVCEKLSAYAATIQSITGLPLDPLLSATKWEWLLEQQPELRGAARAGKICLGTVDSWLLYKMTSGEAHATDHTNASRTALMNLAALEWDAALLDLFAIPRVAMPSLRTSSGVFGVCAAIPELEGMPIVSMIGDSHAALAGHGHLATGTVKATYGTGSSLMMLTKTPGDVRELARTVAWTTKDEAHFALEGNIAMSGAAVQWVGEFLGLPRPIEDAAALAATVPDAAGLVLVPAMVGLGAPYWDSTARGLATNLERSHTAAHLAHAAVDAIAFQVADVLEAMETAANIMVPLLLADGGATRNDALMQMQADILDKPVHRSMEEDLSARGAAMLGGVALGWWRGPEDLHISATRAQVFEPRMTATERDRLRSAWRHAVRRARLRQEPEA